MKADNQPKRGPGRPAGAVKPSSQKKQNAVYVRVTPAVFAYLKKLHENEGFTYSDGARVLLIEAIRARGVLPTT